MIVPSSARSWLGILKYTLLTNSSCQVFLLSERIILLIMFYKAYLMFTISNNSIKGLLLCLGKTTTACLVSAALLRV